MDQNGQSRTTKARLYAVFIELLELVGLGWIIIWRRERDLNPRTSYPVNGFQDHRLKPLGHPSADRLFKALCPRTQ